jgi:hypothetical protein
MGFRLNKWAVMFFTVVMTFAILGGGQTIWQKFTVAKPLDATLLKIDGVEKAIRENGDKKDDPVKINVTLKNASNLQKTYTAILDGSKSVLGGKRFQVTIADTRTAELEQFEAMVQPHMQEAIATGAFTQMVNRIQELAATKGITAQIFIDSRYMYLQLTKDGAELYQVVPRLPEHQEVR